MNRTEIADIWLTSSEIGIETLDGRKAVEYFSDYPRLQSASEEQRKNYNLSYFGIHWPEINEDLSFDGFFSKYSKA